MSAVIQFKLQVMWKVLTINQIKQFGRIIKNSDVSLIANRGNVAVLKNNRDSDNYNSNNRDHNNIIIKV
jgi:hypothetical protein